MKWNLHHLYDRRGIDPAALRMTNFFALYPASAVAAATGLPVPWVQLYSGYLLYVAKVYGGPAFQMHALGGPLLSDNAGGYIAKRSVHDWLYGADFCPLTISKP